MTPAERCSRDIGGEWLCEVYVCEACQPMHDREAHPPEPDHDWQLEQRRDDAREKRHV